MGNVPSFLKVNLTLGCQHFISGKQICNISRFFPVIFFAFVSQLCRETVKSGGRIRRGVKGKRTYWNAGTLN